MFQQPIEDTDMSVLPTSDPGGNRPWLFAGATGYQMVVGAFTTVPGITAHSALTGLTNDDHPQYYNQSRGDARYMPLRPTQMQLGGSTSSFPMLKRSGTQVQVKLADDSAFTELSVDTLKFDNAAGSPYIGKYSNAGVSIYNSSGSLGSMTSNYAILGSTGYLYFVGRGLVSSSANGVVHVQNFDLNESVDQALVLGPGTSASTGVRLKRAIGTTTLVIRNGNDSAAGDLNAGAGTFSGTFNAPTGYFSGNIYVGGQSLFKASTNAIALRNPADSADIAFSAGAGTFSGNLVLTGANSTISSSNTILYLGSTFGFFVTPGTLAGNASGSPQMAVGNGLAGTPCWTFRNAIDTGAWLVSTIAGSRAYAISTDGVEAVRFGGSGVSRAATFAGDIDAYHMGSTQVRVGLSAARQMGMCWNDSTPEGQLQTSGYGFPIKINNGSIAIASGNGNGAVSIGGAFFLAPKTFATLPSASAESGARYRITDRGQKECYSDGTNWLFAHDNSIVV